MLCVIERKDSCSFVKQEIDLITHSTPDVSQCPIRKFTPRIGFKCFSGVLLMFYDKSISLKSKCDMKY